jgi:MFS family permease
MTDGPIAIFRSLNRDERNAFLGSFLGWTLDAFDFFIVTFLFARIATEFNVPIPAVIFANTVTLMFRPLGALIFGLIADRFGMGCRCGAGTRIAADQSTRTGIGRSPAGLRDGFLAGRDRILDLLVGFR